jgi:hypothetical protein
MEAVTEKIPTTLWVAGWSIDIRDTQRYLRMHPELQTEFNSAFNAWVEKYGYFSTLRAILRNAHPDPSYGKRSLGEGGHSSHDLFRGVIDDGVRQVAPIPDMNEGPFDGDAALTIMQRNGYYGEHAGNPIRPRYPKGALRDKDGRPVDKHIVSAEPHDLGLHPVDVLFKGNKEPNRWTYRSSEGVLAGRLGASPGLLPIDQEGSIPLGRDPQRPITSDELLHRLTFPRDVTEEFKGRRCVSRAILGILEARGVISVPEATRLLAEVGVDVVKRLPSPSRPAQLYLTDASAEDRMDITDYVKRLADAWGARLMRGGSTGISDSPSAETGYRYQCNPRYEGVMQAWLNHKANPRIACKTASHDGKLENAKGTNLPDL